MSIVCGREVAMLAGGLQRQNRVSVGLCSAPLRRGMEARVPSHSYVGLNKRKISPVAKDEGVAKAVPVDVLYEIAEGLETPVQLVYLTTLLGFLVVEDYYELGVILLRKKLFTQANSNLKKALKDWDEEEGDEEVLAQVYNALGYSYFNLDRVEDAIKQYTKAVELQPGYLTAWNNLGDVLEKQKRYGERCRVPGGVGLGSWEHCGQGESCYCKTG
eukprot:jgi/Picre1/34813/NNA_002279.t1